jgi:ribosomal protein L7Ae-like RNA K-turn-binding protein
MILLAPDTEESDVIDDKITLLIEEAQQRAVPILYTLKRRQLGKAAGSSMKQAAISICNPEGANDLYKTLMRGVVGEGVDRGEWR